MSWGEAFRYFKAVRSKGEEINDQDRGLPFNCRIGSLIKWQLGGFIRAESQGGLIKIPSLSSGVVKAISKLTFEGISGGKQYRFYLDDGDDGDGECFINVYTDEEGSPKEVMYCTSLIRFIPETKEEQDIYFGSNGYGLGEATYSLNKEQIADFGFDDPEVDRICKGEDEITFCRAIGAGVEDFMEPLKGVEVRIDDKSGAGGLKQEVYFMPYFRNIGNQEEYLLISTEVVLSKDGDSSQREIHVDMMVGITMDQERFSVQ